MDEVEESWSESRLNKPKKYPMPLWLTDEEFDKMVESLWIRRKSDQLFEKLCQSLKRGCRQNRIDYIPLHTDEPLDTALTELLVKRKNY